MPTFKKAGVFFALILFILSLFTAFASAADNLFYPGMRPMSMGGAFVAVADDENGRNWNPAGMMYLPGFDLSLQFQGTLTSDLTETIDLMTKISKAENNGEDIFALDETQQLVDNLSKDQKFGLRAGVAFDLVFPKGRKKKMAFGLGAYLQGKGTLWRKAQGLSLAGPFSMLNDQILYEVNADLVPSFSGAFRFSNVVPTFVKGGKRDLSVGFTVKYALRGKATNEDNPYTLEEIIKGETYEGVKIDMDKEVTDLVNQFEEESLGRSFGLDLGAITDLTDYMRAGLVIQDIFTNITYDTGAIQNEDIPINVRIGTAFYPIKYLRPEAQNKHFNVILSADMDNLNGDSGRRSGFADKLHMGAEMQFSLLSNLLFFHLRGGSNSGFPTYGATLHFFKIQFDYTVYGDEFAEYQNAALSFVF